MSNINNSGLPRTWPGRTTHDRHKAKMASYELILGNVTHAQGRTNNALQNHINIGRSSAVIAAVLEDIVLNMSDVYIHHLHDYPVRMNLPNDVVSRGYDGFCFVRGSIKALHIASQRPSYVKGILVQSRGFQARTVHECCDKCFTHFTAMNSGWTRFVGCVRMPGYFGGACANCVWADKAKSCSLFRTEDVDMPMYDSDTYASYEAQRVVARQIEASGSGN